MLNIGDAFNEMDEASLLIIVIIATAAHFDNLPRTAIDEESMLAIIRAVRSNGRGRFIVQGYAYRIGNLPRTSSGCDRNATRTDTEDKPIIVLECMVAQVHEYIINPVERHGLLPSKRRRRRS